MDLQTLKQYKKSLIIGGILLLIVAGFLYWRHLALYPSTDNAYVQAHVVNIASQINGQIIKVTASNNQTVKKDALLFSIDPKPYEIAVANAKAQLQTARQQMHGSADSVLAAQTLIVQRQAELTRAQQNYKRIMPLANSGVVAKSQGEDAVAQLKVAQAALKAAQEQLTQAQDQLGSSGEKNAQVQAAQAALDKAQLDLQHTQITAPANGIVSNFTLRVGDVVTASQLLFVFIESDEWWVDANFKETQLRRMRPGQAAVIHVDTYSNHNFKGIVDSISSGSGAAFSLLPPENATGNWVKVTQRFPVRIKFINPPLKQYPLRVGASSSVTVDTTK